VLLLIHALCFSLQCALSVLCLHQSLLGNGSQQCPLLLTLLPACDCLTLNPLFQTCLHKGKVKVMLQPTVSRPVFLGAKPHLLPKTRLLLLSDSFGFVGVGCPFWREDGPVIYNRCRSLAAQSFLHVSPVGLMTIFYFLRFETLLTWRARSLYLYPPGTRWPSYTPRHCVFFLSFPVTRRAMVEAFEPASIWASQL
jgi:hypothetical protein